MSLYKKLDCTCGHEYKLHLNSDGKECSCLAIDITKNDYYADKCHKYNPAGHNPELENILCPNCKLIHLEKIDKHYICLSCQFDITEAQVWELVG